MALGTAEIKVNKEEIEGYEYQEIIDHVTLTLENTVAKPPDPTAEDYTYLRVTGVTLLDGTTEYKISGTNKFEQSTNETTDKKNTTIDFKINIGDCFKRGIYYVSGLEKKSVSRFVDLPADYDAIYKYDAPLESEKLFSIKFDWFYTKTETAFNVTPPANETVYGSTEVTLKIKRDMAKEQDTFTKAISTGKFTVKE